MKGFNEFIIEVGQAFNNTIKHGSLELYVDHRHRQQEQSNRKGKVISQPMCEETDVEVGADVIIDPTVLFEQVYGGKMQESRFLVNAEKGWYRVTSDMIILYKNPNETEYLGHKQNLFGTSELVEETEKQTASGILLTTQERQVKNIVTIDFANKELIEVEGIKAGDKVHHVPNRTWLFELDGRKYLYLRNVDLLAKVE
jgi:co-chaperonin GroES (HSP10)